MIDPALGINSIIQEEASETVQPNHAEPNYPEPNPEYIYDKETWGDAELTSYLLRCAGNGPRYTSEFPKFLEGNNFIARQAVECAIRTILGSMDNPESQIEEGVAITMNPFVYPSDITAPFNFHRVSGDKNCVNIPQSFGDNERTIATVHSHPRELPNINLTAPSPQDIYLLTQNYGSPDLASGITNGNEIFILFPTMETPKYNTSERMRLVDIANKQIDRRVTAEINYAKRNFDPTQMSIERLIYFQTINQRVIKDCSTRLADQLGIKMYHKRLQSKSEDERFKRLV